MNIRIKPAPDVVFDCKAPEQKQGKKIMKVSHSFIS